MNRLQSVLNLMKNEDKELCQPAIDTILNMKSDVCTAKAVMHGIQKYFLGPYESKGIIRDAFCREYKKRLYFLYYLDNLIKENPEFQKILQKIKKETSERKIGAKITDMERRMAFLWVGIEHQQKILEKVLEHQKTRS